MNLQALIVQHLRSASEPCTIVELGHAVGVLEPGDTVPERLRSTLTGLVRHQQVKRLHNGDGVLRYSAMPGAPSLKADMPSVSTVTPPAPRNPAPEVAPAATSQPTRHRYQTGVSERVLAAFEHSGVPLARSTLEGRIYPPLSKTQVLSALIALRNKGLVERVGTTAAARWVRLDGKPAPVAAAPSAVNLVAIHAALLHARLEIDAALQALEA